ncbi:MAG: BamA/TamA family outer membrane protein [bacterium]
MISRFRAYILVLLTILAGCGGAEKRTDYVLPGTTDYKVEQLSIRGVEAIDEDDLRSGLATREDPGWRTSIPWMPILGTDPVFFNFVEWDRDLQRIVTYYQSQGYFDAKVVSRNVLQDSKTKSVRLQATVSEGKPTYIQSVTFTGLEGTGITSADALAASQLKPKMQFTQAGYVRARDEVLLFLQRKSFAHASLRGRVVVDPKTRSATVTFLIDPGPACQFGDVTIEGLETVDPEFVQRALAFSKGDRFDPQVLQDSQEAIYGLRVFSLVKVMTQAEVDEYESFGKADSQTVAPEAADSAPELGIDALLSDAQENAEKRSSLSPIVPIVIRLKETKMWNVRVGVSAEAEVNRQAIVGRLDWSNPNLFGGLRRVEHFNSAGYAWAPGILDPLNDGWIVDSELRFTRPQFLERLTNFKSKLRLSRDVFEGYNLLTPQIQVGLERPFFKRLTVEILYNFSFNRITSIDRSLVASDEFIDDYVLEYLQQTLRLDFRNDLLNPTRGWMLEFMAQEATEYLTLGQTDYLKFSLSGQVYVPFRVMVPMVLALRARGATIYNVGRATGIPIPEKLYAGGVDSMRSFGRQQVSYYTQVGEPLPIGAQSEIDGAVEQRIRVSRNALGVGDVWLSLFLDTASVARGQLYSETNANDQGTVTIGELTDSLLYGTGFGLYWLTPIGPIRGDFAYTLSDITNDPRFRRCPAIVAECTEANALSAADNAVLQKISGYSFYIGIGHSF